MGLNCKICTNAFTLLAATAVAISFGPTNASIGDTLERSYGVYAQLPTTTTEAKAKGWVPMSSKCTPGLGVAWAEQKGIPVITAARNPAAELGSTELSSPSSAPGCPSRLPLDPAIA